MLPEATTKALYIFKEDIVFAIFSQFSGIISKLEKDLLQKEPIAKIYTGTRISGSPYNSKMADIEHLLGLAEIEMETAKKYSEKYGQMERFYDIIGKKGEKQGS